MNRNLKRRSPLIARVHMPRASQLSPARSVCDHLSALLRIPCAYSAQVQRNVGQHDSQRVTIIFMINLPPYLIAFCQRRATCHCCVQCHQTELHAVQIHICLESASAIMMVHIVFEKVLSMSEVQSCAFIAAHS